MRVLHGLSSEESTCRERAKDQRGKRLCKIISNKLHSISLITSAENSSGKRPKGDVFSAKHLFCWLTPRLFYISECAAEWRKKAIYMIMWRLELRGPGPFFLHASLSTKLVRAKSKI
jgi:hypothetical protein